MKPRFIRGHFRKMSEEKRERLENNGYVQLTYAYSRNERHLAESCLKLLQKHKVKSDILETSEGIEVWRTLRGYKTSKMD